MKTECINTHSILKVLFLIWIFESVSLNSCYALCVTLCIFTVSKTNSSLIGGGDHMAQKIFIARGVAAFVLYNMSEEPSLTFDIIKN